MFIEEEEWIKAEAALKDATYDAEEDERKKIFKSLQVNKNVMNVANKNAIFMHCLPAHRGEEVTSEVLDSKSSVVWQEAENRLHAQKALLEYLLITNI